MDGYLYYVGLLQLIFQILISSFFLSAIVFANGADLLITNIPTSAVFYIFLICTNENSTLSLSSMLLH